MRSLRALGAFTFAAAGMALTLGAGVAADAPQSKAEKKAKRLAMKAETAKKAEQPAKPADPAPIAPEPPAAAPKPPLPQDAAALAKLIDRRVNEKLAAAGLAASPVSADAEFLRRAALDITGVIPTGDKARQFLDDPSPDKRTRLIDELLADPNYGRKQSDVWTPKLYARDSMNRFISREPFAAWIQGQFNSNTPWNTFVASLVDATGTVDKNPAVTYFLANRTIDKLTDTTTQHFLGVRLGCAQCHNHPFTETKQTEYWGMAAFYGKVQPDRPQNANKGGDNSELGVKEGNGPTKLKDFFPESTKKVPPKFLGGAEPKLAANEPYRPALAKWLTSAENPFFTKAIVNRTWAAYFGNGIVDPVDDMIETRVPSHPELLAELADHFGRTGFDLKYLVKAICLSDAYQRSAKPAAGNAADRDLFSHMNIKMMSPEELFDSLALLTGAGGGAEAAKGKGMAAAGPKGQGGGPRAAFVNFFLAGNEEPNPTEYEAGIPQALKLMNSRIAGNPQSFRKFGTPTTKPAELLERMYLAALTRRPTADELKTMTAYLAKAGTPAEGYADILWVLVNSSEFRMVR